MKNEKDRLEYIRWLVDGYIYPTRKTLVGGVCVYVHEVVEIFLFLFTEIHCLILHRLWLVGPVELGQ